MSMRAHRKNSINRSLYLTSENHSTAVEKQQDKEDHQKYGSNQPANTMIYNVYSISKNFVIISSFQCQYRSRDGSFYVIDTTDKICRCHLFFDRSMCHHVLAACIAQKVPNVELKVSFILTILS